MNRLAYPFYQEWHAAINKLGRDGSHAPRWMYEAKAAADEVPRLARLFSLERRNILPPTQLKDSGLECCLGVKCAECDYLKALENMPRCTPEHSDIAKAWTCAAHIISEGGDTANIGYVLTGSDRRHWSALHAIMAGWAE